MASLRAPLLDLHHSQSSSPLTSPSTVTNTENMSSGPIVSDQYNNFASMSSHSYVPQQDSGLGIRTDENNFLSQFDHCDDEQCNASYFDSGRDVNDAGRPCKLASPFDEHYYTNGNGWTDADASFALENNFNTPYGTNHDPYFPQYTNGYGSVQYMTPYSGVQFSAPDYLSTPSSQFKRPLLRHRSVSSAIPQTTVSTPFQAITTGMDTSSNQWITPGETQLWEEPEFHHEDQPTQFPGTVVDFTECDGTDQNSSIPVPRQKSHSAIAITSRRKPHLRPSLSESCVPRHSSARARALSMGQNVHISPDNQCVVKTPIQQLPLPPLPPSVLIKTPHLLNQTPTYIATPMSSYRKPRSMSNTPQRWRRPSSPPASDLNNANMPFLPPVKQDPTFPGDLYTPRYKRRTSTGRWEGWCGYCQPGRWLDLKNSRFWEDKLRNHGICAKSKVRFAEPEQIRWVAMDGKVCQAVGLGLEVGDLGTDQKKREGLCGVCKTWIPMDGMRTKARDRAVGWWMHAYKCHDHEQPSEQHTVAS